MGVMYRAVFHATGEGTNESTKYLGNTEKDRSGLA